MKKTRWIILGVLVFFASLLLGMNRIVRAENGTLINSIDGASIRIKSLNSEQGLMFSAVLDEAVKEALNKDIVVVFFDKEESGMRGSNLFANTCFTSSRYTRITTRTTNYIYSCK
jgi:hypothetical protein